MSPRWQDFPSRVEEKTLDRMETQASHSPGRAPISCKQPILVGAFACQVQQYVEEDIRSGVALRRLGPVAIC